MIAWYLLDYSTYDEFLVLTTFMCMPFGFGCLVCEYVLYIFVAKSVLSGLVVS